MLQFHLTQFATELSVMRWRRNPAGRKANCRWRELGLYRSDGERDYYLERWLCARITSM